MAKHIVKGFVTYRLPRWEGDTAQAGFVDFKPSSSATGSATTGWGLIVGPQEIEVEIPDDFDPRPVQIAALDEEERKVRAAFSARITDLQRQRSQLLALDNQVEAVEQ